MIYLLTDIAPHTGPRSIGAYRLATELRSAGYDVEIIDFLSAWNIDDLLSYIDTGPKPLWIGFSTTFMGPGKPKKDAATNSGWDALTRFNDRDQYLWTEIKKRSPIVLGGSRVSRLKFLYNADWIISGYADDAIVPLSDYIAGKSTELKFKLEKIKHILTDEEYETRVINCEESYPVTDLSRIETVFHDTDFIEPNEVLPIEISRGCIFKCAFCAFPLNGKTKNDYIRPKESIIKDIKVYQQKYKSNRYFFMDDTFNDTVEKMQMIKEVYDSVEPFDFWAYGRLDLLAAKPEMLDLVNKIGWKYFSFGIETFNRSAGKRIGKGADPDKLKKVLTEIKKLHPSSWFLFEMIVGLPGEDAKSINETVNWFLQNPKLWDEIHFKELSISNKDYNTWNSSMSLDPEKFGVSIIEFNPKNYGLKWKHETMTVKEAVDLSNLAQEKINHIKPRSQNNYFITLADITRESIIEHQGKNKAFIKTIQQRNRRYILNKLSLRNNL